VKKMIALKPTGGISTLTKYKGFLKTLREKVS
jgi:hypothetical protein